MADLSDYQADTPEPETDEDAQPQSVAAQQEPETEVALPEPTTDHARDETQHKKLMRWIDSVNIADELDDSVLGEIGQRIKREFDIDENSRSDWMTKSKKAMDLAMQVAEAKQYPWPRACLSLDTDILTSTGWKPIADVKVGEFVYSRCPQGVASYHPITQTYRYKADNIVHFKAKSIDLLVTTNHNMLVENHKGESQFIQAQRFLESSLPKKYIPLTSKWMGRSPVNIHGISATAYMRFLGWYISEGSAIKTRTGGSSFVIAQSKSANPVKFEIIKRDIEACGFTWRECKTADRGIIVHAKTMPLSMKKELRGLGIHFTKRLPEHVLTLNPSLIKSLLDTMVMGDGHARLREGKRLPSVVYTTTSSVLAGQVQDLLQKVNLRGTIYTNPPRVGGSIKGRQIKGTRESYTVNFNHNKRLKILRMKHRKLLPYGKDVACVEVAPYHTIYVRRNGIAVWCGNSNVIYPLMTTAAIQFAARAYPAIVSGKEVVKGTVVGEDVGVPAVNPQTGQPPLINPQTGAPMWIVEPGAKNVLANKIGEHMSWQLLDEQPEWEAETDKLLHILPIAGCCFRKTYFDSVMDRNSSTLVPASKLVINYHAKSLETAPRVTEEVSLYPLEITEYERQGMFREISYTAGPDTSGDEDAPVEFLEQHRWWDLDGDDYPEPYVITVDKNSAQVVRIVARYDHDSIKFKGSTGEVIKITPIQYYTQYDFLPNPEGGIYGVGFGQLLRPINEAINTSLNMMIDAGHLQVVGGGFIGKGLSMHMGAVRFSPGEYKPVNATGATVKENIVPLPTPGPSTVLFQLLGTLIEAGKEIAAVKDVLTGEQKNANIPATTTLALIEQGLKVFTAIYKRIHRALKKELDKAYRLNSIYLPEAGAGFRVNNEWKSISRGDYRKANGVQPVSDPSMVSDMQKLGRAQFLMGFANDPYFDGLAIRKRVLDAAMIEKPDELLVKQLPPNPDMVKDAAKLEQAQQRINAEATKDIAQAILFITQADAALGDAHLGWAQHQLEILKTQMEALTNGVKPPTPDQGPQPSGTGDVAAPSGLSGPIKLPSGLPSGSPGSGVGVPAGQ